MLRKDAENAGEELFVGHGRAGCGGDQVQDLRGQFRPLAFGDVADGLDGADDVPLAVEEGSGLGPDEGPPAAIQPRDMYFRGQPLGRAPFVLVHGIVPAGVLADEVQEDGAGLTVEGDCVRVLGFAEDPLLGQARHGLDGPVPGDDAVLRIDHQCGVGQELDDVVQALLRAAQGLFGQDAVGDFADEDDDDVAIEIGEAGFVITGPAAGLQGVLGLVERCALHPAQSLGECVRVGHLGDLGHLPFEQGDPFQAEKRPQAAPAVLDHAVAGDPQEDVRQGHEHGAHEGVALHELSGADFEGPVEDLPLVVEMAIGLVHETHEGPDIRGHLCLVQPGPFELSLEETVHVSGSPGGR
ncbi:hypothetical protein DSECCO2_356140 [anaerobic digester metagenome]